MVFKKIGKWMGLGAKATEQPEPPPFDEGHVGAPPAVLSGHQDAATLTAPDIPIINANDSPWGVPMLDVRPVTHELLACSTIEQCGENLSSMMQDDGLSFIGQAPMSQTSCPTNLIYKIDRQLAEGILFSPHSMEDKWAIFHYDQKIICVRSWLRRVAIVAHVAYHGDTIEITRIDGSFEGEGVAPAFNERSLDFLLRSHVLRTPYPVPLPENIAEAPYQAALWCFAQFGNRANYATPFLFPRDIPDRPMRVNSLLHLAVVRGEKEKIKTQLESLPIHLLAADGRAPLHWAIVCEDKSIPEFVLNLGSPVDIRAADGATALMAAAEANSEAHITLLLARGANPNAIDNRGFTALHRAAEMGHDQLVKLLLDNGADASIVAEDYTARSLAEKRERVAIVAMLPPS